MKMPESVETGPFLYRVHLSEIALDGYNGGTNFNNRVIAIDGNITLDGQRETLLHEVLHCTLDLTGLRSMGKDEEENLVASLSPWLLMVLRDNPELVKFLCAK